MRGLARLWFTGAWWVLPAGVLGGVLYTTTAITPHPHAQPVAAAARAGESALLVFGFAGAACATAAARLRQARWLDRPVTRPRLAVTAECLRPVLVATAVALAVTMLGFQLSSAAVGWPGWGLIGVNASILLAACLWGYALGRWVTAWVAAPLVLVATYVVLGFPASLNPLWVRHLFGVIDCCRIDESLSPRVIAASILVAVGSAAIAVAVILAAPTAYGRTRLGRCVPSFSALTWLLAAMTAAGVCASVATSLVSPLSLFPTTMRDGDLVCRDVGEWQRLCVWPEHVGAFEEYKPLLQAVRKVELDRGLTPTRLFTERMVRDPRAAYLDAAPGEPPEQKFHAVVAAMSPDGDRCAITPEGQDSFDPSQMDIQVWSGLRAWWSHALAKDLKASFELDPLDPVVAAIAPSAQASWVQAVTAARRMCRPGFAPSPR